MPADPDCSTYAGVVSRESIHIALTYAALNDIDILAVDICNAYLQAPSSQKMFLPVALTLVWKTLDRRPSSDENCMAIKLLAETSPTISVNV